MRVQADLMQCAIQIIQFDLNINLHVYTLFQINKLKYLQKYLKIMKIDFNPKDGAIIDFPY